MENLEERVTYNSNTSSIYYDNNLWGNSNIFDLLKDYSIIINVECSNSTEEGDN